MRKLLTSNGYTFVDALVQIMLFFLFSNMIYFYFEWLKDSEKYLTHTEEIEFELFSLEILPYLKNLQHVEEQTNSVGIRFRQSEEEFDIEFTGNLIRKQKNRLGHEPMLLHITKSQFQLNGTKLKIAVEFESGLKKERVYELSFAEE